MVLHLVASAALFAAGFGVARIKSAKTVAAIKAELAKVEGSAVAEVKSLVAAIKAKLL